MKKYYITSIVTLLYVPIITISAELWVPLKNFLKATFWHHWLGKGVVLIGLYLIILGLLNLRKWPEDEETDAQYFNAVILVGILSALSIFGFFVYEYTKHSA